jgi:aspartate/methionine/tyrosine aminotransferase
LTVVVSKPAAIAARMDRIEPFYVMALLERAKELQAQGVDVIHMEVGEPDFATPRPILEAGQRALAAGHTRYTPARGLLELRRAIADYYRCRYRVDLDPRRVLVTPGASGGLNLLLGILLNPGERVLLTDPGYPCNRHFVHLLNGIPESIRVDAEQDFLPTLEQIAEHWRSDARLLMLASPGNPGGTLATPAYLRRVNDWLRQRGGYLILDEIYQGLEYGVESQTLLQHTDEAFVVNSFSKYFCMTGWRLGWVVVPEGFIDAADRLAQNIFLAAPTLSQYAALAAFQADTLDILEQQRLQLQQRRDFLLPALRELGFRIASSPQGAFYLYADCSDLVDDSMLFAQRLLETSGVAVTPGRDFGSNRAERHVRFAYTTDVERLRQGVERIRAFLQP